MNKKPFNLEAAQAGKPIVTRDGRPYKYGAYNPDAEEGGQLAGWIDNVHESHCPNGKYRSDGIESESDLFMLAETKTVWVVAYYHQEGLRAYGSSESKDDAIKQENILKNEGWKTYGVHPIEIEL